MRRKVAELADNRGEEIEIGPDENVMGGHTGRRLGQVRDLLYDQGKLVGRVTQTQAVLAPRP